MGEERIGPWAGEDYQSFVNLGERIAELQGNALAAGYGLGRLHPAITARDFETVEEAWQARRAHPVYKWLQSNEHFRAAWATFKKLKRQARNSKLVGPVSDLVFLRIVVESARFCFLIKDHPDFRFEATAPKRRSAIHHAEKLLELLDNGVQLSGVGEQTRLRGLLRQLCKSLRARSRKEYEGPRIAGTRALELLAYRLVLELDLRSPSIVEDIALMVGLPRDRTTCGRYVRAAAAKWRSDMANALRDQHKSTSD